MLFKDCERTDGRTTTTTTDGEWSQYLTLSLRLRWAKKKKKMATGHETYKLGRQSSNDHNCQIWFVMEKMQFNHFPHYKSMGAFCCHGSQTKRQINIILAILNCPYPSNICTKLESYCFSVFEVVIEKNPFLFNLPWQPNKMATGHKNKYTG